MGVLGLWQLLAPVGQPVTLESLENKVFAVDISIWLNQAVKGYRDSQGGSVPNAHLLSLFSRLCKLLFYKIRPIIVFDGGFPELKKQTIINRQQRRAAVKASSRDFSLKILTNYLASQQLEKSTTNATGFNKVSFKGKTKPNEEIFKLPPLPESSQSVLTDNCDGNMNSERKFSDFSSEDIKYLNKIDIESDNFNALPADVKQEILSALKESRKHRSWDQYDELPEESNEFSKYQMQCLLKKRKLQSKLEEVQKDLRQINSSAYVSQYTNDHVIGEANKIMSDDTSYYVLLKKIIHQTQKDSKSVDDVKPSTSVMADTKSAFIRDIENIDLDEDYFSPESSSLKNTDKIHKATVKIKQEIKSLDLSDEEFMIDNPPTIDQAKENYVSYTDLADEESIIDNPLTIDQTKENYVSSTVLDMKSDNAEEMNRCVTRDSVMNDGINKEEFLEYHTESKPRFERNDGNISQDEVSFMKNMVDKSEYKIKEIEVHELEPFNNEEMAQEKVLLDRAENKLRDVNSNKVDPCNTEVLSQDKVAKEINENSMTDTNKSFNDVTFTPTYQDNLRKNNNLSSKTESIIQITRNAETENDLESKIIERNSFSVYSATQEFLDEDSQSDHNQSTTTPLIIDESLHKANLELQKNLDTAAEILEAEQAKQDRQSSTIQDHMIEECKELLQLFGIPYVVSPLEAEAQCAFYDIVDFTHGTITDDSDVWLFGGKRVYKNFFTQQKFVECYKSKEIFNHFGLNRHKLINFALLTGSDYTEGVEGVGPVTAMEIISEFPGEGIEALHKFKVWWQDANKHTRLPENKVRAKFQKLVLAQSFPDEKVFDAYLNPEVDSSMEKFTWGRPDLDALRDYTKERFAWNQSKVDNALLPVLKKMNDRDNQMHIDSFFTVTLKKSTNLFPSKRIMSALKKITSPEKQNSEKSDEGNKVKRKARNSKKGNPKKMMRKSSSVVGGSKKKTVKSQGPALSESSSESDS